MNKSIKFYKVKIIKRFTEKIHRNRNVLLQELAVNATDPVVFNRRIRMLKHLNMYENQIIAKIQNFETDDINDLNNMDFSDGILAIMNRSA